MFSDLYKKSYRKIRRWAVIAAILIFAAAFDCSAYAAVDTDTKVSFLSGLNAWDMPSLSSAQKGFLKFMVKAAGSGSDSSATTSEDMSGIGNGINRRDLDVVMRTSMEIILNTLCGNAYYNQVASGVKVNLFLEGGGGNVSAENDTRKVTKIETVVDEAGRQAIAGANERYKATQTKLAGLLVSEAGVTADDTQVEALRKINNWICSSFTYDEGAFGYTVDQTLDTKRGVCGQFSQIVKFSCDYLGIPCDLIADAQMIHAYNRVTIDGTPYYIDVTWNNTEGNPEGWFLKTAAEFSADHGI